MIKKIGDRLFTLESDHTHPQSEVVVERLGDVSKSLVARAMQRVENRFTQEEALCVGIGATGLALALGSELVDTVVDGNMAVDLVGLGGVGMVATAGLVVVAERLTRR